MTSIAIFILFACAPFAAFLTAYVRIRSVANGMLSLGISEFHDSVSKIMRTPNELPDDVLRALGMMNRIAASKRAHWLFLKVVKDDRLGKLDHERDEDWRSTYRGLRPELQELLRDAVVAWTRIIVSRNILAGALINLEMVRLQVKRGKLNRHEESEALKVLPALAV